MDNKGFSLIEILSVIILFAIMLITIIAILGGIR